MIIHGYAATILPDTRGQHFAIDALTYSLPSYVLNGSPIRVKHLPADEAPSVGRMLSFALDDLGLYIVAKITDKAISGAIGAGIFHSFSVAGKFNADEAGSIYRLKIEEISVCDNPACKKTRFKIWRKPGIPSAFSLIERIHHERFHASHA